MNGEITDGASSGFLRGPVDQWVDQVTDLVVTHGFDTFILWADGEGQLAKFAEEVAPAVREQVAEERAGSAPRPTAQYRFEFDSWVFCSVGGHIPTV